MLSSFCRRHTHSQLTKIKRHASWVLICYSLSLLQEKVSQWLFLCLLLPFLLLLSQMPSVTWLSQVTSPRMGHSLHPIFPKHIRRKWSAIISWLAVAKRGSRSPSQTLICINHPKNDQLESLYIPTHTLFFLPKTVTPVFPLFFPSFILAKMSHFISVLSLCLFL